MIEGSRMKLLKQNADIRTYCTQTNEEGDFHHHSDQFSIFISVPVVVVCPEGSGGSRKSVHNDNLIKDPALNFWDKDPLKQQKMFSTESNYESKEGYWSPSDSSSRISGQGDGR